MKLFALFDWDKTIRHGGYVMFDFIRVLVEKGIIDENVERDIGAILKNHSEGYLTYTEMAEKAIQICR